MKMMRLTTIEVTLQSCSIFENGRVHGGRTWPGLLLFDSQLFSQAPTWFSSLACFDRIWDAEALRLCWKCSEKRAGSSWKACTPSKLWNWFCSAQSALAQRPPKSFFQDEECESCNEMLQHQILALYLSKMLLSRLLIDSGNTWQSSDWPDAASSPPCSSSSKDINVSSTSISAWSFVSVLATTKTPPKVPGLMLLQNHLHTWDLKCIVLSTIKVLVCNHVKPLFIVHCHLSAAAMHCYAEFDHEHQGGAKHIWPLGICRVGRSQRSMWADRTGRTPGQAGLWGWCAYGLMQ